MSVTAKFVIVRRHRVSKQILEATAVIKEFLNARDRKTNIKESIKALL